MLTILLAGRISLIKLGMFLEVRHGCYPRLLNPPTIFFAALHKLTLGLPTGLSFTLSIDWATSWSWHRDDMEIQPYTKKVQLAKWI